MSTAVRCLTGIIFLSTIFSPPRALAQTVPPSHWASPTLDILRAAEILADSGYVAQKTGTRIAGASPAPFRTVASDGTRYELAALFGDIPVYRKTANVTQSRLIGVERTVADYGLEGDGVRIGLWDIGHPYGHAEFGDRLHQASDGEGSMQSGHATHVAGTLIASGIDTEARGVAPRATVTAYGSDGDYLEMYEAAQNGLRVSNHSYAFAAGWERVRSGDPVEWTYFGSTGRIAVYNTLTWFWDWVSEDNPMYLVVKAAGNDAGQGPLEASVPHYHNGFSGTVFSDNHTNDCSGGHGCLGALAMSRNAVVVGSLDATGGAVSSFSSRGPTIDGRLKPDLMAVGEGVYSTVAGGGYAISSGTSMAAPMATGAVALILDEELRLYGEPRMLSSTIKALLIHTADDVGAPGPDYASGWGRINTTAAVALMESDDLTGESSILEPVVEDVFELVVRTDGSPIRATLAWIDPRGEDPTTRVDPTAPILVHDFDLEVSVDGQHYLPWVLDPSDPAAPAVRGSDHLNNVEQVDVPFTPRGYATIRVTSPPGVSQRVSLVITSGDHAVATGAEHVDSATNYPVLRQEVNVYPNPVAAGTTLHVNAPLSIEHVELYNMVGRRVAEWTRPGSSLQLSASLAPGVYVLRMSVQEGVFTKRVIVA